MEKDIRTLILNIVNKAMIISNNTKADVFVDYLGHTNNLTVSYHSVGWNKNKYPDYRADIYINVKTHEEILIELRQVLEKLEELQSYEESLEGTIYEEQ